MKYLSILMVGVALLVGMRATYADGAVVEFNPNIIWQNNVPTLDSNHSTLSVGHDGTVYCTLGKSITAIDGENGKTLWVYPFQKGPGRHMAVGSDDTVYSVASREDKVHAINGKTGERVWVWDWEESGGPSGSPAIGADGTIYICGDSGQSGWGYLYAINGQTGKTLWKWKSPRHAHPVDLSPSPYHYIGISPVIAADGTIYIGGRRGDGPVYIGEERVSVSSGQVVAIDGETGKTVWEFTTNKGESSILGSPAIGTDGTLYTGTITNNSGDSFMAIDGKTGRRIWTFKPESRYGDKFYDWVIGDGIVYARQEQTVYALDTKTGQLIWEGKEARKMFCLGIDGTLFGTTKRVYNDLNRSAMRYWGFDAKTGDFRFPSKFLGRYSLLQDSRGNMYSLYATGNQSKIVYKFKGPSGTYVHRPWPVPRQNLQRTGRVDLDATTPPPAKPQEFSINVISDSPQSGSATGGGTYEAGTAIELIAEEKPGYLFSKWSDESTEGTRLYTVTSDANLTAYFTPDSRDNDLDGLTNFKEIVELGTNPNERDSDGDGHDDGNEVTSGSNPLVGEKSPENPDLEKETQGADNDQDKDQRDLGDNSSGEQNTFKTTKDQTFVEGWIYTSEDGWQYTNQKLYPFIYSQQEQGWLWFQPSTGPQRRFFHYGKNKWIERNQSTSSSSSNYRLLDYDFTIDDSGDLNNIAPYHEITGSLTIKGSAIATVDELSNLRKVGGHVFLMNTDLESLAGLGNLQQIGGGLYLNSNHNLQSLRGLNSLRNIGGHLHLYNNTAIHSLSGAHNLRSVGGDITIVTNPQVNGLDGLANLRSIKGKITLTNNDSITSLQTLPALDDFGGQVEMDGNDSLPLEQVESFRSRFR